jgi:hypothetical protein
LGKWFKFENKKVFEIEEKIFKIKEGEEMKRLS